MASDGDRPQARPAWGQGDEGRRIARAPEPRPASEASAKSVLLSRHKPEIHAPYTIAARDDAIDDGQAPPIETPPIDFHDLDLIRDELDQELPPDFDDDDKDVYQSAPHAAPDNRSARAEAPPIEPSRKAASVAVQRPVAAAGSLNPVVPPQSVAGRALMLVVGIMCFLACLSVGALVLVEEAARDWQLDVSREVTVQVKPVDGVPIEPALQTAINLARATNGVRSVRLMSEREGEGLLEPWLGSGFDYSKLPVPRLILIDLVDPALADLKGLTRQLAASVPNAELDDHSIWAKRLRTMAGTMVAASVVVLVLVLTAMVLSVVFATRAAMAGNRDVVQVLHFVGAEDAFIAGEFQHHFLILGFKGGVGGGLAAMLAFIVANWVTEETQGMAGSDQAHALFGSFAVGLNGYLGAAGIVLLVAGLTALTSRLTVRSYLNQLD
jgi:cell division transport system permease protein